ncbi:MAG: hypothetical protein WAO83_15700 [Fuerstiella sp.]
MKFRKSLTSYMAFGLAVFFTVGSMYTTVDAASQDESQVPPAPLEFGDVSPATATGLIAPLAPEPIDPGSVLHSRQQQITLDANGGFNGRLSSLQKPTGNLAAASGMAVKLVRNGAVIASTVTNEDGGFSVTGLSEGVVALLAYGESGLLMYSVQLVKEAEGLAAATPVKAETVQLSLSSAIVASSDVVLARQLIFDGLPERDHRFAAAASEAEASDYPFGTGESSTSLVHHQVQLRPDGALVGEVNLLDTRTGRHREIVDLTLHFLRDGQHLGATEVAADGRFVMSGLTPGIYSIVTTGDDGILAMGIDVLGSQAQVGKNDKYMLTSVAQQLDLVVCPVNAENFNQGNAADLTDGALDPTTPGGAGAPIAGAPPVGGPMAAGTPGGGFGGSSGGGGVGGGGGLGALLAAGAAGAIGYAIGDDNNPASPAR